MSIVFDCLPNLAHLTLTYGAKHVGMEYERPLFGMKMSDAKVFSECLKMTQSLVYLSLPGNLIDDDLITILIFVRFGLNRWDTVLYPRLAPTRFRLPQSQNLDER